MPLTTRWDEQNQLLRIESGDEFTLQEVAALNADHDFGSSARVLWDLTALRRGPASRDELYQAAELAEKSESKVDKRQVAIVVKRELDFGLARMFQVFSDRDGIDYQVFRSFDEALSWLGPPDPA
jgi:hypothetical protein